MDSNEAPEREGRADETSRVGGSIMEAVRMDEEQTKRRRGLFCVLCGTRTIVKKTKRPGVGFLQRRRRCPVCELAYTTAERFTQLPTAEQIEAARKRLAEVRPS